MAEGRDVLHEREVDGMTGEDSSGNERSDRVPLAADISDRPAALDEVLSRQNEVLSKILAELDVTRRECAQLRRAQRRMAANGSFRDVGEAVAEASVGRADDLEDSDDGSVVAPLSPRNELSARERKLVALQRELSFGDDKPKLKGYTLADFLLFDKQYRDFKVGRTATLGTVLPARDFFYLCSRAKLLEVDNPERRAELLGKSDEWVLAKWKDMYKPRSFNKLEKALQKVRWPAGGGTLVHKVAEYCDLWRSFFDLTTTGGRLFNGSVPDVLFLSQFVQNCPVSWLKNKLQAYVSVLPFHEFLRRADDLAYEMSDSEEGAGPGSRNDLPGVRAAAAPGTRPRAGRGGGRANGGAQRSAQERAPIKCYNCNKEGHKSYQCPEKRQNNDAGGAKKSSDAKKGRRVTKPAVAAVEQPIRKEKVDQVVEAAAEALQLSVMIRTEQFPVHSTQDLREKCVLAKAVVDTGADVACISQRLVESLEPQGVVVKPTSQILRSASGQPMRVSGKVDLFVLFSVTNQIREALCPMMVVDLGDDDLLLPASFVLKHQLLQANVVDLQTTLDSWDGLCNPVYGGQYGVDDSDSVLTAPLDVWHTDCPPALSPNTDILAPAGRIHSSNT